MKNPPVLFLTFLLAYSTSAVSQQEDVVLEAEDSAACLCPKPGLWRLTNLEGWMECNVFGIKRKLKAKDKNDGVIWVLGEDCSTIFTEADERKREDVLVDRGRDCLFFGFAPGQEEGAEVIFDGAYKIENEEFMTGEFYLDMSGLGADCEGYRPFEAEFLEPLSEKDYARREKKMQEKLEAVRETLEKYQGVIDNYLEKTDGGKAFGGRSEKAHGERTAKER